MSKNHAFLGVLRPFVLPLILVLSDGFRTLWAADRRKPLTCHCGCRTLARGSSPLVGQHHKKKSPFQMTYCHAAPHGTKETAQIRPRDVVRQHWHTKHCFPRPLLFFHSFAIIFICSLHI